MNSQDLQKFLYMFLNWEKAQSWTWLAIIIVVTIGFLIGFFFKLRGLIATVITLIVSFGLALVLAYAFKGLIVKIPIEAFAQSDFGKSENAEKSIQQITNIAFSIVIPLLSLALSIFGFIIMLPILIVTHTKAQRRKRLENRFKKEVIQTIVTETHEVSNTNDEALTQSEIQEKTNNLIQKLIGPKSPFLVNLFKKLAFGAGLTLVMLPSAGLVTNVMSPDAKGANTSFTKFGVKIATFWQGRPIYEPIELIKALMESSKMTEEQIQEEKKKESSVVVVKKVETDEKGEEREVEVPATIEEAYPVLTKNENEEIFKPLVVATKVVDTDIAKETIKENKELVKSLLEYEKLDELLDQSLGNRKIQAHDIDKVIEELEKLTENENFETMDFSKLGLPEEAALAIDAVRYTKNELLPKSGIEVNDLKEVGTKLLDKFTDSSVSEIDKNRLINTALKFIGIDVENTN
ncbi:hypothetical protein C4M96_01145 [Mycoplasmopsis pullorum]|uniref:hypothetical protein n=1 Tax=Mycoplasmopsis pullorum TaxID=48003 RepID=UPI001118CAC0|nr:hypothetical protein [Mycoplasmopsis pullorum]TNK83483.1 hypothetical protein C4M93_02315 [Mycoplasmopsis pullorum]TNK92377.1 hypothetical protein C4M96_01145 [Mycoplasmopsis pullorum]